jgi:hypothetical protein
VNSLWFIVCGSTKIISFSVRRFLPMFWSLQNQNNGAATQLLLRGVLASNALALIKSKLPNGHRVCGAIYRRSNWRTGAMI